MAEVGTAFVTLAPSAKGFGRATERQVGGEMGSAGKSVGGKFGSAMKVGALAAFGAALAGAKILGDAVAEAREAAVITARTSNVIKTMGGVANVSAKQVADLAESISLKTGVDDEAIQSGQNLLLTFGNIRNEAGEGNKIFDRTSQLMVDMSAAMGTDAKGSAIQLGKALNDPVKGVSALSRVGVSFTEQQKEQIKTLVESGKQLGAQKVILAEVEKQFGGAAAAMSTPADRAKVAFGNLKEELGAKLLPVVDKMLNKFVDAIPTISRLMSGAGRVFSVVVGVVQNLGRWVFDLIKKNFDLGQVAEDGRSHFENLKRIFVALIPTMRKIGEFLIPIIAKAVQFLLRLLPKLSAAAIWLWNNAFGPALKLITRAFGLLLRAVGKTLDLLAKIPGAPKWIGETADAAHHAADELKGISDSIQKIPDRKRVAIDIYENTYVKRHNLGGGGLGAVGDTSPRTVSRGLASGRTAAGTSSGGSVRLVVDGAEFNAYVEGVADGRVEGSQALLLQRARARR